MGSHAQPILIGDRAGSVAQERQQADQHRAHENASWCGSSLAMQCVARKSLETNDLAALKVARRVLRSLGTNAGTLR